MTEYPPQPVDSHHRNCYCFLWHESPEILEKEKLPYGYCGWCEACGEPGHTRHSPRGPCTGAWCDSCWNKMLIEIKLTRTDQECH